MKKSGRHEEELPVFVWDLWYTCNYRCSYCFWELDRLWDKLAAHNRVLPPETWIAAWERVRARCGAVKIDIVGGEPLIYPGFGRLLSGLAENHALTITTNLSLPVGNLRELVSLVSPQCVRFNASFHPEFTSFESFTEKILLLKSSGYEPGVLMVAWPPLLPRMKGYGKQFADLGIPFTPMIFQGTWERRNYPGAYTETEKQSISELLGGPLRDEEIEYRLENRTTLGKLCHAGKEYANIKGTGEVFRCGQDAFRRRPMGNILDSGFALFEKPLPCQHENCSCQEFRYLDEILVKRHES